MNRAVIIALLLTASAACQVIQVAGGTSTILGGAGGEATLYFPSNTALISGGIANGRAGFGLADAFKVDNFNVTIGDRGFAGMLDGLGGISLQERGIFIERSGFGAFVGATGAGETLPFFQAAVAQHIGAGITYHGAFGKWRLGSVAALSGGTHTAATSATYNGTYLKLTGAGGLLASKPIIAGSVDFHPDAFVRMLASRQNLWENGQTAVINNAGLFAGTGHFSANVGAYSGQSGGVGSHGVNGGISARFGLISETSGYFNSGGHALVFHALTETTRRWSLTQNVSQSRGQTNFGAGASYHTNRIAVSVSNGIGFSPTRGYVHTTSISITLRVHDSAVTLAGNQSPGMTRYSAYGSDYTHGPLAASSSAPGSSGHQFHTGGNIVIKAHVTDRAGQPVEGAAVALCANHLISNSNGEVTLRTKAHSVTVTVLPEEFSAPGQWKVVRVPEIATADVTAEIIVERAE
jgi:hypothetical protein